MSRALDMGGAGAHPGDLLVLGGFVAAICLVFALVGAIVDDGGLYDRWVAMQARRRRRLTRTFTTVAATSAFTLALPAFATPRAEVVTVETAGQVSATSSDVLPSLVEADTSAPAPVDVPLRTRASAGINPPAGDHGEGSPAGEELAALEAVRWCESRDSYTAENPVSSASGAFQFIDSTWEAVTGLPAPASRYPRDVQDAAFLELWDAGAGATHWHPSAACWQPLLSGVSR